METQWAGIDFSADLDWTVVDHDIGFLEFEATPWYTLKTGLERVSSLPAVILALWCNWLTRRPLKAESPGSSPGNATNL